MGSLSLLHGLAALLLVLMFAVVVCAVGRLTKWRLIAMVLNGAALGLTFQMIRLRQLDFAGLSADGWFRLIQGLVGGLGFMAVVMLIGVGVRKLFVRSSRQTAAN